jgi:hypothetical protein
MSGAKKLMNCLWHRIMLGWCSQLLAALSGQLPMVLCRLLMHHLQSEHAGLLQDKAIAVPGGASPRCCFVLSQLADVHLPLPMQERTMKPDVPHALVHTAGRHTSQCLDGCNLFC